MVIHLSEVHTILVPKQMFANVKLDNLHFEKGKKYVLKYDYKTSGVTNLKDYPILGQLSDGIISIIPRDDNQWASVELEWKTLTIEFEASKTNDAIRVGFYNNSATFEHAEEIDKVIEYVIIILTKNCGSVSHKN